MSVAISPCSLTNQHLLEMNCKYHKNILTLQKYSVLAVGGASRELLEPSAAPHPLTLHHHRQQAAVRPRHPQHRRQEVSSGEQVSS